MARKKKEPEAKGGCPEWLAQYGDMVTLVLTFFVLLFSFSTIDAQKWKDVVASLSGTPSIFEGLDYSNDPIAEQHYKPSEDTEIDMESLMGDDELWEALVKEVADMLKQSGEALVGNAVVNSDAMQIKIDLSGDILFDPGSDVLKGDAADILVNVITQLEPYLPLVGTFRIEGHTDNVPMNTPKYPSNWELSGGRAMTVLRYLLDQLKDDPRFPRSLFSFGGYGEEWPVATNDTPEGRALNRRVTFVIVKDPTYDPNAPLTAPAEEVVPEGTETVPEETVPEENWVDGEYTEPEGGEPVEPEGGETAEPAE